MLTGVLTAVTRCRVRKSIFSPTSAPVSPNPFIARYKMSSAPATKKLKSTKVIGTHSGTFHCDEALAVYMLRLTDEFRDADVVRTRDPAKLEPLDIVVDVGGVYDPSRHRYDHHQRGFTEVFGHGGFDKIKLSSAGLVYKHFGKQIIAQQLGGVEESDPTVELLWLRLYSGFIESVDAIDNGVNIATGPTNYSVNSDLSSRVKRINPNWNESTTDETYDNLFQKASAVTGDEFMSQLEYYIKAWLPARDIVREAMEKRLEIDPSGAVVRFDKAAPWKDHLFLLEPSLPSAPSQILYVLYPESEAPNSKWRIQCVPVNPDSFENRKSLPEAWRGVRDQDLSKVSGIDGCVFCHASGFTAGAETYEGVLEMAKKAIAA
ncbi:metal-dependent protein hydrolase [Kockovaella imperatae]|uniref:Metal-dependent protein hydrolase n=1 Tax=Kockovaella imperatae TaxID=4999 RepID=A0A1Y1UH38_9TREE|nr:metal-dependent protein hydrolase [Kockovaella imperatae]ORX37342.1 metal-dependent protein hydrolase [Kockovaella imperatae]